MKCAIGQPSFSLQGPETCSAVYFCSKVPRPVPGISDAVAIANDGGRLSALDDFCKKFHGGESGPPRVVPYTLDDVVAALNSVAPYDWREFFQKRVYQINTRAPLGGVENAGWHLAYTNEVSAWLKAREGARKFTDLSFSLGFTLREDGSIIDVLPGSTADKEGIGPAMKLVAVNGRRWTPEILREAVKSAAAVHTPVELLVENDDYFRTHRLRYNDGEKYPCLQRDAGKPDLLAEILKPLTATPADSGR